MDKSLKQLGINIAKARKAKGLTQAGLAELTAVKQATVSGWESGDIDIPYKTLHRIAEKLSTSPASLVDTSIPVTESLIGNRLEAIQLVLSASEATLERALAILRRGVLPSSGQESQSSTS